MGFLDVFSVEFFERRIYGTYHKSAFKIDILDYLLELNLTDEDKDTLTVEYSKYNKVVAPCVVVEQTSNPSTNVYWSVGVGPVTPADVLAMTQGTLVNDKFSLFTGAVETKFSIAIAPNVDISQISDLTAANSIVTAEYIQVGTIEVTFNNIGYTYRIYEMNNAIPYSTSHQHEITV